MKLASWILAIITFVGTGCSEPDNQIVGGNLYETNHGWGISRLQYLYINNRVDQIIFIGDNIKYTYLKVNYQSNEGNKIRSIVYSPDDETFQQKDTIIYQEDHVIQIIKTTRKDNLITREDTSNFVYDQLGHLVQARYEGVHKQVDFLDYKDNNFTRFKVYNNSRLFFDVSLKYDDKQTPFRSFLDLNLVIFNNNLLEGFEYLADHNITESVEQEYQSTVFVNTYKTQYSYDIKNRPTNSVRTRVGDKEIKVNEFYNYQ